jgi:hypothetical protein
MKLGGLQIKRRLLRRKIYVFVTLSIELPFPWSPGIRCDPEGLLRLLEWKHNPFFAQLRNTTFYGGAEPPAR